MADMSRFGLPLPAGYAPSPQTAAREMAARPVARPVVQSAPQPATQPAAQPSMARFGLPVPGRAPSVAAPAATGTASFVIDDQQGSLAFEHRRELEEVAAGLQEAIPALKSHGIFGRIANILTMRPGPRVEVKLGSQCGSCVAQKQTVGHMTGYFATRPGIKYAIVNARNDILAKN